MLEASTTAIIMGVLIVFLLVLIPFLDSSERFRKYISLRYTLTGLFIILATGCILDFSHLSDETRNLVITGSLILTGVFVSFRSVEKIKIKGNLQIKGEYKDLKGEVNYNKEGSGNDGTQDT